MYNVTVVVSVNTMNYSWKKQEPLYQDRVLFPVERLLIKKP